MSWWETLEIYWHKVVGWLALLNMAVTVITIGFALMLKKDTTSALAWCLTLLLLLPVPFLGMSLFVLLGYQHVRVPLRRRAEQKRRFRTTHTAFPLAARAGSEEASPCESGWEGLASWLSGSTLSR